MAAIDGSGAMREVGYAAAGGAPVTRNSASASGRLLVVRDKASRSTRVRRPRGEHDLSPFPGECGSLERIAGGDHDNSVRSPSSRRRHRDLVPGVLREAVPPVRRRTQGNLSRRAQPRQVRAIIRVRTFPGPCPFSAPPGKAEGGRCSAAPLGASTALLQELKSSRCSSRSRGTCSTSRCGSSGRRTARTRPRLPTR